MDNLYLDSQGVLSLTPGLKKINTTELSDYVSDMYAKQIGPNEAIWVGLNQDGHLVQRSLKGDFSDTVTIANGNSRCFFGDAFGNVLAMAGAARVKDNGTASILNLGLATAGTPVATILPQPTIEFGGDTLNSQYDVVLSVGLEWVIPVIAGQGYGSIVGGGNSSFVTALPDTTSLACILETQIGTVDCLNINGQASDDPSTDNIQFQFTPGVGSSISAVQLAFVLDSDPFSNPNSTFTDGYVYGWGNVTVASDGVTGGNNNVTFQIGQNNTFNVPRGQFLRLGNNSALDWTKVTGLYIFVQCVAGSNSFFNAGRVLICGGALGQLNGIYQYLQVDVNDNGIYQAKSPAGSPTAPIQIINGSITLTPAASDPQANQCWFYRISVAPTDGTQATSFLNQYYLVAQTTPGVAIVDSTSDDSAIEENIVANTNLQTMLATDPNGLGDTIYGIEGIFYERMFYLGLTFIYISDDLNPDAVDVRYTLKPSGDPLEKNLWIKRLTNNVLILGTSKNLYEISGDLTVLPDGTLNINIIPIGEAYPPLSNECWNAQGCIFYIASDGPRLTTGSNSTKLDNQLDLLFQGQTRAAVPPVTIIPMGAVRYPIAVGKTHLYAILPLSDGTVRLLAFHMALQYWRIIYTDPVSMFVTPTDRVLLGYNDSANPSIDIGDIFQADYGSANGVIGTGTNLLTGMPITFQTVYDANNQPRNRKDTFTLKLIVDTGGAACNVFIGVDDGFFQSVGQFSAAGLTTIYFPLNNFTLGFRYAIQIKDQDYLTIFKLYEMTIEYEPRPEQLDYLRILPDNLGTISRKRITAYAFVIDTLGNPISFQPYLDNIAWASFGTINNPTKLTYIFYFLSEAIATDIAGILSGGVFEFYGLNLQECISEKLPVPVEFLIIPANNYGTPNRKRHTSYKFQILTRGQNVQFTPILDGIAHSPAVYNTLIKQTVEYFFPQSDGDVIGIDIGGTLASVAAPNPVPFEFYGVVTPQKVEELPDRLEYFRIPNSNFEIPARKRLRTLPMVLDTYGFPVTFTPIVDGVLQTSTTTFNVNGKTTVFHYFSNDVFGTDFGGILQDAISPFEFYGMGTPEDVEVLPVGKRYDQLGPIRFDKIGKCFGFRIRLLMEGVTTVMPYQILGDYTQTEPTYAATVLYTGTFNVYPGFDNVYEIFFPKNVNSCVFRLVLGPTADVFHRYDVMIKVQTSGMESDSQWMPIK